MSFCLLYCSLDSSGEKKGKLFFPTLSQADWILRSSLLLLCGTQCTKLTLITHLLRAVGC